MQTPIYVMILIHMNVISVNFKFYTKKIFGKFRKLQKLKLSTVVIRNLHSGWMGTQPSWLLWVEIS